MLEKGVVNDEPELVGRALHGDKAAFERLILRYAQAVRGVAYGAGAEAEDIAQETFLRAYAGLHMLREPAAFGAWLLGIARNICRDERTQQRPSGPVDPTFAAGSGGTDDVEDAVRGAIDALPDKHRVVIEMRHFDQLSYEEIGRRLDLTRNGVNARLTRARVMLRDTIERHGLLT
ncbi:MAG: sigma factor [Planctomycetota bacterium]